MTASFEVIDHTADVGIVARGRDLAELFVSAARGMFFFIIPGGGVEPRERQPVTVEAEDLEGLLIAWLNELLVILNGEAFLPADFLVEEITETRLRAVLAGEAVDPRRHQFRLDVKAATYHMLEINRNDIWSARVIFDV